MLRKLLIGFTAGSSLLLAGCQSLLFATLKAPTLGQKFTVERLQFSTRPALQLDVYRPPAGTASGATVVFFYGGSWRNGKRGWYRFVGATLAERGIVTVIPDYRKAPEVQFPAFVEDAALAVAHVYAHIEDYGGDPRRVFLMGHSAGAQIAALLATDSRFLRAVGLQPQALAGLIGLSGPYDFLPMTDPKIIAVFNGDARNPHSQAVNFVDGDEPPMLLLHGSDDRLVGVHNSENLHRRLAAARVRSQLKVYPGVGHVGMVLALGRGFRGIAPVLGDVLAWIAAHETGAGRRASPDPTP